MIYIKEMEFQGLFSFNQQQKFVFEPGLYLIEGRNKDVGGSNGSGKSSLFRILTTCLFEENDINRVKDNAIFRGKKSGWGRVLFSKDGKDYEVIYSRGGKLGTDIFLKEDGKDIRGSSLSDTKKKIIDLIGFDYDFFQSIFYLPQQKFLRFVTGTDSERMDILTEMLGLTVYDRLLEKVKEDCKQVEVLQVSLRSKLELAKNIVESINVEEVKKNRDVLKDSIKNLENKDKELELEKRNLTMQLDRLFSIKVDIEKSKKILELLESRRLNIQRDYEKYKQEFGVLVDCSKELNQFEKELQNLKDMKFELETKLNNIKVNEKRYLDLKEKGICPTCLRPLTEGDLRHIGSIEEFLTEKDRLTQEIEQVNNRLRKCEELVNDYRKKQEIYLDIKRKFEIVSDKYNNEISNIENQIKEVKEKELTRFTYEDVVKEIDRLNNLISELENNQRDIFSQLVKDRSNLSVLESKISDYEKYSNEVSKIESDLSMNEDKLKIMSFWIEHLSDKGIKRFKILQVSDLLNDIINKNLEILTDGVMKVYFEPFSVNKKGEIVKRFSLSIQNGLIKDLEFSDLSGGEKQLVALSVLLAFWKYTYMSGTGCNLLMLDEVFGALDERNRLKVCELLQTLKNQDCSVMCITHEEEIKSSVDWDKVIVVEKENGESVLRV